MRPLVLLSLALVAACTTASESADNAIPFQGQVTLAGQPADTRGIVYVRAFGPGFDAAPTWQTATLDSRGHYHGAIPAAQQGHADSLVAIAAIPACGPILPVQARVRVTGVATGARSVNLPTLDLGFPASLARLGRDTVVCGETYSIGAVSDQPGIRLSFDTLGGRIAGRWVTSHAASLGSDFGYFDGSLQGDTLTLVLTPVPPYACTGLTLQIPLTADSTFVLSRITGTPAAACHVPLSRIHFFQAQDGWNPSWPLIR